MSNVFTPLQVAERLLNGIENVGIAAGRHEKAAYQWRYANATRLAGDFPSVEVIRTLFHEARRQGFPLELAHLIFGATEDEVAAIIAGRTTNETQAA
jgi:hypothetical protein